MVSRAKKSRRGVSYLVTVVLMTLIAVALSTLLYAYFSGWIGERTSSTGPTGALSVVEGYYDSKTNNFTLYVRNDGSNTVNVTNAYVVYSNGTVVPASVSNDTMGHHNNTISPGEIKKLYVNPGSTLPSGVYRVKLVADDGSQVVTTIRVK